MNKKDRLNFTYRVIKSSKTIDRCQTHSKRVFYNRIRSINWQNSPLRVYLRVSYGKAECNHGCICNFYNDGWYETRGDLISALEAFAAERLPERSGGQHGYR